MNNEQTNKSLGEVLRDSLRKHARFDKSHRLEESYYLAALDLISHVLQGAKWVLLEPEDITRKGDKAFWCGKWLDAYIGRKCGDDVVRRPISLPSSVRPDGKPEGPSTTPPASSGAAGADVQPALIDDEGFPYSAEPVVEETTMSALNRSLLLQADLELNVEALTSERDQLRKELESTKATFKVAEQEVIRLTTENAALRKRVNLDPYPSLTQAVLDAKDEEIDRLRSQFRWTPVSERLPTEKDADKGAAVWVLDADGRALFCHWRSVEQESWQHWMTPIPLPSSSPETEEQKWKKKWEKEFEQFWIASDDPNPGFAWTCSAAKAKAKAAFLAAKKSTP